MDEERFWGVIERNEGDADAVRAELEKWSVNDIVEWHRSYYDHHNALHRALLLSAAWVILGECSSDGFHYFKAWVIGKGRRAYEMAIADPDSLGIFVTKRDLDGDCDNMPLKRPTRPRGATGRSLSATPTSSSSRRASRSTLSG